MRVQELSWLLVTTLNIWCFVILSWVKDITKIILKLFLYINWAFMVLWWVWWLYISYTVYIYCNVQFPFWCWLYFEKRLKKYFLLIYILITIFCVHSDLLQNEPFYLFLILCIPLQYLILIGMRVFIAL